MSSSGKATERWLRYLRPACEAPTATVVLLPHAGGAAHAYAPLIKLVRPDVDLVGVEYPGHGTRWSEPAAEDPEDIVSEVARRLLSEPNHQIVLLGHSLGGILGYEVAGRLQNAGRPVAAFIASSSRAPHVYHEDPDRLDLLSREELERELLRRGDIPADVAEERELLSLVIPLMMRDLRLAARYVPPSPLRQLDHSVLAVGGTEDSGVPPEMLAAWEAVAGSEFRCELQPGGHFYYRNRLPELARLIGQMVGRAKVSNV
jgi:pyochelin biosynthetic protein PchC